jgi:hypothetical protein
MTSDRIRNLTLAAQALADPAREILDPATGAPMTAAQAVGILDAEVDAAERDGLEADQRWPFRLVRDAPPCTGAVVLGPWQARIRVLNP